MAKNCKNCQHSICGAPDPMCDICDDCRTDPDTGWGGFTDHSIDKHFNSEEEAKEYYKTHDNVDNDDDEADDYL